MADKKDFIARLIITAYQDEPAICVAVKLQEELQAGEQRANCVADIRRSQGNQKNPKPLV